MGLSFLDTRLGQETCQLLCRAAKKYIDKKETRQYAVTVCTGTVLAETIDQEAAKGAKYVDNIPITENGHTEAWVLIFEKEGKNGE